MGNPVPGNLIVPASQAADIGSFYIAVTALRELGFTEGRPQMRKAGLLMDMPSAEQKYAVPFGPVRIGRTVLFKDGDRPGGRKPQMSVLEGSVIKRGVEPLQLTEADRMMARIPVIMPNVRAHGESERLLEDQQWTQAIEAGTTPAQSSYDSVPFFSAAHLSDPTNAASPVQSNLLTLDLTADNYGAAQVQMETWVAENGMPLYYGFRPQFVLMVHPYQRKLARKILGREHVSEGGAAVENIEFENGDLIVNPFLTSQRNWYLFVANAGFSPVWRIVHRPMERWDLGPNSALYQATKAIEFFADEWTDYRCTAWPTALKSVPK